jgi:rhodanese-related sulfurtransferase
VDVREPDEVALGSIPSSVNLPLSELKDALSPNFGEGDFKKVGLIKPISGLD